LQKELFYRLLLRWANVQLTLAVFMLGKCAANTGCVYVGQMCSWHWLCLCWANVHCSVE